MAIARRGSAATDGITAAGSGTAPLLPAVAFPPIPGHTTPVAPSRRSRPGLATTDAPPADDPLPDGRLRRCTFRHVRPVVLERRGAAPSYAITCLYEGEAAPLPIGDLESAQRVCAACILLGVFRPDKA